MSLPRKCVVANISSLSGSLRSLINLLDTLNDASSLVKLTLHFKELRHDPVVRCAKSTHVTIDSAYSPRSDPSSRLTAGCIWSLLAGRLRICP